MAAQHLAPHQIPADLAMVEAALVERSDIAAVIIEPTGASYGATPLPAAFLHELRRLTTAHDVRRGATAHLCVAP